MQVQVWMKFDYIIQMYNLDNNDNLILSLCTNERERERERERETKWYAKKNLSPLKC